MTIAEMTKRAFETSKAKGFITADPQIDRKLLLSVGELIEAQNELRNGHEPTEIYFVSEGTVKSEMRFGVGKPEGFPIELADVVIRVGQMAEELGIDLEAAVAMKMAYNDTRPFKHGKQF